MQKIFTIFLSLFIYSAQAQNLNFTYAKTFGNTGQEDIVQSAVDISGNVISVGSFNGTVDFDPGPAVFNLTNNIYAVPITFVTKTDAAGNFVWAKAFEGNISPTASSLTLTAAGEVIFCGSFSGQTDFDPGTGEYLLQSANAGQTGYIVKLSAAGDLVWAKLINSASNSTCNYVITDNIDNIFISGICNYQTDMDPGVGYFELPDGQADPSGYILKLDAAGNFVWAKGFPPGAGIINTMNGLCTDAANAVYITGTYYGTIDFDPGTSDYSLTASQETPFIVKLDALGNFTWAGQFSHFMVEKSMTEHNGNIYLTGEFRYSIDTDPSVYGEMLLTAAGNLDIFIIHLEGQTGNYINAIQAGNPISFCSGRSIIADAAGNIYSTGTYNTPTDFDPGPATANLTGAGSYIWKLDASLNFIAVHSINTDIRSIMLTATDIYFTGLCYGASDADPNPNATHYIFSNGGADIFTIKCSLLPKATVTTTLTTSANPSAPGDNVTLTATMSTAVNGSIDFYEGYTLLANVPINGTSATYSSTGFTPGDHSITATFNGSAGATTSTSAPLLQKIRIPTSVTFTVSPNPANLGSPVTYTATVTPSAAAGTVKFADNGIGINNAVLSSGQATYTGNTLSVGNHNITAQYLESTTYAGSTSAVTVLSIIPHVIPIVTGITPNSAAAGSTVMLNGANFNTTAANNTVYFGAARATVVSATANQLQVTAPAGSTYRPVSVLDMTTFRTGYSKNPFMVSFANPSGSGFPSSYYDPKTDIASGTSPSSVAIADFDGDGKPDLVIANKASNTISVYPNISAGGTITAASFGPKADIAAPGGPAALLAGDVDGDGKQDIVVVSTSPSNMSVFRNIYSSGTLNASAFAASANFGPLVNASYLAMGDLDRDGKPEMVVGNVGSASLYIFRNNSVPGSISMTSTTINIGSANISGLAVVDLNGDGLRDIIYTIKSTNALSYLLNFYQGGSISVGDFGIYQVNTTGSQPNGLAMADINQDGKPDVVISTAAGISLLQNTSPGGMSPVFGGTRIDIAGTAAQAVIFADADGNGKPDIITVSPTVNKASVYQNQYNSGSISAGSFAARQDFTTGTTPTASAMGDLNGDGIPELFSVNSGAATMSVLQVALAVVPVTFTEVNAYRTGSTATVSWKTAHEMNIVRYEAQRSADGQLFSTFATALPAGNGTVHYYSTIDNKPLSGINYYRVKSVDLNGALKYSRVIPVNFNEANGLSVYPQPVINNLTVTWPLTDKPASVQLMDAQGRLLATYPASGNSMQIAMGGYSSGSYILKVGKRTTIIVKK